MKKEERKIIVKLLETEQMNTYKILAEFFAKKFNENGFDKVEQKWFNNDVSKRVRNSCTIRNYIVKKKEIHTL